MLIPIHDLRAPILPLLCVCIVHLFALLSLPRMGNERKRTVFVQETIDQEAENECQSQRCQEVFSCYEEQGE